ncbi:hypothetical protein E2986_13271 [Frieseomelitta varia]|uniref:Uncharacterized protein n=1 Tax=Frieseomelitta varia TaxID=561572 RepID=A0A833W9Y9_9HYME|nr:hypothetical protein E2986_13271 [Frieseomelitta varia]
MVDAPSMAVEVLEWAHEEAKFVLEGRLLIAQPTDNNWRRGRTVKLAPVTAMLVTNGKMNALNEIENKLKTECNIAYGE